MTAVRRRRLITMFACAFALAAAPGLTANGPAPTKAAAQFEVRFMTEMIDHHAMAIMMAELCLGRAAHLELRTMCTEIIAAQSEEIATMQTWLASWYGVSHAPEMTPGMENQMERMAEMSGAAFEITFMKSMIRHHWKAVVRASQCVDRAYHDELIDLCGEIIEAQVAEITQLRAWLCAWYGICQYGPKGQLGEDEAP